MLEIPHMAARQMEIWSVVLLASIALKMVLVLVVRRRKFAANAWWSLVSLVRGIPLNEIAVLRQRRCNFDRLIESKLARIALTAVETYFGDVHAESRFVRFVSEFGIAVSVSLLIMGLVLGDVGIESLVVRSVVVIGVFCTCWAAGEKWRRSEQMVGAIVECRSSSKRRCAGSQGDEYDVSCAAHSCADGNMKPSKKT